MSPEKEQATNELIRSARVRAIECWLEHLGTPSALDADDCDGNEAERALFILDNDFGELTTVMYLLLGQDCFRGARVLVSPRVYEKNHDALPGRNGVWTTEQDLLEAIDQSRPRVVVLASAYLMPVHGLLSAEALERVVSRARSHHASVVTADPFLGLLSQWATRGLEQLISIDIPEQADSRLRLMKRRADALLHKELAAVEKLVEKLPHLYPAHCNLEAHPRAPSDGRNLGFFNEALCLPPHLLEPAPGEHTNRDRRHWMFVISEVDFQTQCMFLSAKRFAKIVSQRLTEAAELGRHAVLLGPAVLCAMVQPTLPQGDRIQLLAFCSFRRAMSLLLSAEYCFYWNVVSHTILMQLQNARPVFLFDRGHLVRAVPALYERVIAWYYQGYEPPYLDHEASLSLPVLADVSASHARCAEDRVARFRRAPPPAALLEASAQH